jgi:3-dehydroquinate dehydratase
VSSRPAREAILAIQSNLEGELLALAIREGEQSPEVEQAAFTELTSAAVWEAIFTLANHVDELRSR